MSAILALKKYDFMLFNIYVLSIYMYMYMYFNLSLLKLFCTYWQVIHCYLSQNSFSVNDEKPSVTKRR